MTLCEFEIDVLRTANGEEIEGMSWGAGMGQALGFLKSAGYVAGSMGRWRFYLSTNRQGFGVFRNCE